MLVPSNRIEIQFIYPSRIIHYIIGILGSFWIVLDRSGSFWRFHGGFWRILKDFRGFWWIWEDFEGSWGISLAQSISGMNLAVGSFECGDAGEGFFGKLQDSSGIPRRNSPRRSSKGVLRSRSANPFNPIKKSWKNLWDPWRILQGSEISARCL